VPGKAAEGDVDGLDRVLRRLRPRLSERKLRLFACACLRQAWHLLPPGCRREAVEVSERFADGLAADAELADVRRRCWEEFAAPGGPFGWLERAAWGAAWADVRRPCRGVARDVAEGLAAAAGGAHTPPGQAAFQAATDAQERILRDVAPPVLPALPALPSRLREMAQACYAGAGVPLPILADALEEAGVAPRALLDHCRGAGPHVRGCWALDWLLGRS
jgi:hypothetical protein